MSEYFTAGLNDGGASIMPSEMHRRHLTQTGNTYINMILDHLFLHIHYPSLTE